MSVIPPGLAGASCENIESALLPRITDIDGDKGDL